MRTVILTALLAAPAAAQSPMYGANTAPAASTATVTSSTGTVSASTATVVASSSTAPTDEVAGHGFKVGGAAPKAKLARPMHAVIQKDAADWEPIALKEGGVPGSSENLVSLKVVKVKGRMKGENSKARSGARLHKGAKDSRWLAITLYPKALERKRAHLEVRLRIFEGYVEQVEIAAVTVTDRRRPSSPTLFDSFDLREQGIEYEEERPGSGLVVVSELDPRPGAAAANAGRLEKAEFADKDLGFVNLSWSTKGLKSVVK